jgi:hypothetical protein
MCVNLSEDLQQGLNARDQAVFDEQLAALPQVRAEWQAVEAHKCTVTILPTSTSSHPRPAAKLNTMQVVLHQRFWIMHLLLLLPWTLQVLQAYLEAERATAAAAITDGPLASAQEQTAELQVIADVIPESDLWLCPLAPSK